MSVFDPLVELLLCRMGDVQVCKELRAQCQVGDLIVGPNVVDVVHLTLMQDCVESIRRISSKEISSGRSAIAVQNNWLSSLQQAAEFGNDFCRRSVMGLSMVADLLELTLRVLMWAVDIIAAYNDDWQLETLLV